MSIQLVTPEELRRFFQSHHEDEYVLVDVRRPEEYRRGHIPGARLLPVNELVQSMDRLPADKTLIFYCHSGGRSMAAAVMAAEEDDARPIFNLHGGMLAWDGGRLSDVPQVRLFYGQTRMQMLQTAIGLEKGAQRFYEAVARNQAGRPQIFTRLAGAELAHAKTIYRFWKELEAGLEPFESLYEGQSGEILEGGLPLQAAMQKLSESPSEPFLRWIETALQIEYAAYDLYRTMAGQENAETPRQAFMTLAQAEKAHMQLLIEALD